MELAQLFVSKNNMAILPASDRRGSLIAAALAVVIGAILIALAPAREPGEWTPHGF
jgi:hypothetical protein